MEMKNYFLFVNSLAFLVLVLLKKIDLTQVTFNYQRKTFWITIGVLFLFLFLAYLFMGASGLFFGRAGQRVRSYLSAYMLLGY